MSDELANAIVNASENMRDRDAASLAATVYLERSGFYIKIIDDRIPKSIETHRFDYFEDALKALRQHDCVPMMGKIAEENFAIVEKACKAHNVMKKYDPRKLVAVFRMVDNLKE